MSLAPIVLFVYNRPWHTRQTVESLQKNILADESELFIFSEGPKNETDKIKVNEVRDFIHSISGFKEIKIEESKENTGLAESVIRGVTKVINQYGKVIVLEDDLISAPGFLKFMNEALEFYKDYNRIFSISGYGFPIEFSSEYKSETYILPRSSSWGWGTWLEKWKKADWQVKDIGHFLTDKNLQKKFNEGGTDLTSMLKSQMYGYIDSWGIRWAYTHFKNNGYCLYPVNSLIKNIGTDKSGTHFKSNVNKYDVKLSTVNTTINLEKNIEVNHEILRRVNQIFKLSLLRKTINFFKLNPLFH